MSRYFLGVLVAVSILLPAVASETPDEVAQAFVDNVDQFSLTVTIRPRKKDAQDLRSVRLDVRGSSGEPHAIWQNGKPMSASENITDRQALALIKVLGRQGFFKKSGKFYSEREVADPKVNPPPDGALDHALRVQSVGPGYDVQIVAFGQYWYTYYELTKSNSDRELLLRLIEALDGRSSELLSALEKQLG